MAHPAHCWDNICKFDKFYIFQKRWRISKECRPVCCQLVQPCIRKQSWRVVDLGHNMSQRGSKRGVNWVEDSSNPRWERRSPLPQPPLTHQQQREAEHGLWESHHLASNFDQVLKCILFLGVPGWDLAPISRQTWQLPMPIHHHHCHKLRKSWSQKLEAWSRESWPQPLRSSHRLLSRMSLQ